MLNRKINIRFIIYWSIVFSSIFMLLIGAISLVFANMFPDLFPPYINLINAFLVSGGVIVSLLGNLLADVIGLRLIDIFKNKNKTRQTTIKEDDFPFNVVTDPWKVLPILLSGPGIIPDHKLPYHRRKIGESTTDTIRELLFQNRRILISGTGGIGKTRETGKLLSELIDEGYTVLIAKNNAQLDTLVNFPDSLRNRIVFCFDDIHQRCADPATTLTQDITPKDFLDNLSNFIIRTEKRYGRFDVLTIFIARSDVQAWSFLQYPNHSVWNGVFHYELPYPDIECQKNFILHVANDLNISVKEEVALDLAHANDFTFRNLIQNLYRAKLSNATLTKENFTSRQGQTWEFRYQTLREVFPREIPFLFDTLVLLKKMKIPLRPSIVAEVIAIFILGTRVYTMLPVTRQLTKNKIYSVLSYLQKNGDLFLDTSTNEYIIHESMLSIKKNSEEKLKTNDFVKAIAHTISREVKEEIGILIALAKYSVFQIGNLKLGIQLLTRVLRVNPNNSTARYIRAQALLFTGFLKEALIEINIAHNLDPDNPDILIIRGIINGIADKLEEAENDFNQVIVKNQKNIYAYINRANVYLIKEKYKKSISDLTKAIAIEPNDTRLFLLRANAHWANGEKDKSFKDLDKAQVIQPSNIFIYMQRAQFLLKEKLLDEAMQEILNATEFSPDSPELLYVKSLIYHSKKNFGEALTSISQAIFQSPYQSQFYQLKAEIYFGQGRKIEGLRELNKALTLNPHNPKILNKRALFLRQFGVIDIALNDLAHSLVHNPLIPDTYLQLGKLQAQRGQIEQALEFINKCLQLSPENAEAYHARAHIYGMQHKTQLAIYDFDKAVELEPENSSHLFCRGEFKRQHHQREAIKDLAIIKDKFTDKVVYHFAYIAAQNDFGRLKRAKQIYLRELSANPNNVLLLTVFAYISFLEKNIVSAEEYIKKAISLPISNPVIETHLLWVAAVCKKPLLQIRAILRISAIQDPEFLLDYTEHIIKYIPLRRFASKILIWVMQFQLGISKQGYIRSRYTMFISKFRNRNNIIKKQDITI